MSERPKPKPRERGTSRCRKCGGLGHFTKTCERWTGQQFGGLTVVSGAPLELTSSGHKKTRVRVKCECGAEKLVRLEHLTRGAVTSCGCRRLGMSGDPLPEAVVVFGAKVSMGELSAMCGLRPDRIWARMRRGATAEEAAFGKKPEAAVPLLDERVCAARSALSAWHAEFLDLRDRPELAPVFAAIATTVVMP